MRRIAALLIGAGLVLAPTPSIAEGDEATPITPKLSGRSKAGRDVLRVNAASGADGTRVRLQRKTTDGWKQAGKAGTLNARGDHWFNVIDRNGDRRTPYRARIAATSDRGSDTTNVLRQR